MNIIVRCCGERTEKRCIELAKKEGTVHIVREHPFGESLRKSYKLAMTFTDQKWVPMVDADVILIPGQLKRAIEYLELQNRKIFCLDGKTKDKVFMGTRRAGIHIYKRNLLQRASKYIDDEQLKPESYIRRTMANHGYATVTGTIVFGYHDYEQYYCDLWRKAICQTQKLARKIKNSNIRKRWETKANKDPDFRVILAAHLQGCKYKNKIIIDSRINYGAELGIKKLGLTEKGEL